MSKPYHFQEHDPHGQLVDLAARVARLERPPVSSAAEYFLHQGNVNIVSALTPYTVIEETVALPAGWNKALLVANAAAWILAGSLTDVFSVSLRLSDPSAFDDFTTSVTVVAGEDGVLWTAGHYRMTAAGDATVRLTVSSQTNPGTGAKATEGRIQLLMLPML